MRLIYPVAALVGVLVLSACSHTGGSHHNGQPAAGKHYSLTYEQVREAAQDGDADAQYALGYMYYYGQNVTRNANQARFWIGRAAAQNHQQAIRALKMMDAEPRPTVAQTGAGPRYGASQNSWQEVRRHPEAVAQPERLRDKTSTQAKVQTTAKTTAKSTVKAENESKTVGKKHHRAQLHKKNGNKHGAKHHRTHTAPVATHDDNTASPKVAKTKSPTVPHSTTTTDTETTEQGTQAGSNSTGTPSPQSTSAPESTPESTDGNTTNQPTGASPAGAQGQKSSSAKPSMLLAQEKNTHPVRKTALNSAKSTKAQKTVADASESQNHHGSKGHSGLTSDERSILAASSQHYTLQLIGTSSKSAIQQVIDRNHLQQKAKVYHTKVKGKDFYVLIYGSYPTQEAANDAISRLPANIQQLKPWAKPFAAVKASIQ